MISSKIITHLWLLLMALQHSPLIIQASSFEFFNHHCDEKTGAKEILSSDFCQNLKKSTLLTVNYLDSIPNLKDTSYLTKLLTNLKNFKHFDQESNLIKKTLLTDENFKQLLQNHPHHPERYNIPHALQMISAGLYDHPQELDIFDPHTHTEPYEKFYKNFIYAKVKNFNLFSINNDLQNNANLSKNLEEKNKLKCYHNLFTATKTLHQCLSSEQISFEDFSLPQIPVEQEHHTFCNNKLGLQAINPIGIILEVLNILYNQQHVIFNASLEGTNFSIDAINGCSKVNMLLNSVFFFEAAGNLGNVLRLQPNWIFNISIGNSGKKKQNLCQWVRHLDPQFTKARELKNLNFFYVHDGHFFERNSHLTQDFWDLAMGVPNSHGLSSFAAAYGTKTCTLIALILENLNISPSGELVCDILKKSCTAKQNFCQINYYKIIKNLYQQFKNTSHGNLFTKDPCLNKYINLSDMELDFMV